jgi:predicted transcriptional regulator
MDATKNISVSFRVSARFKRLLDAAAAQERRSRTNMLETLLFAFCEEHGIQIPAAGEEGKKKTGARKQK